MGIMKTLHVVGYKNSGKTTLIARWVRLLKEQRFFGCCIEASWARGTASYAGFRDRYDAVFR